MYGTYIKKKKYTFSRTIIVYDDTLIILFEKLERAFLFFFLVIFFNDACKSKLK